MISAQRTGLLRIACVLSLLPGLALAEQGGLTGRTVLFSVLTYDDPAVPIFIGRDYAAKVVAGPEFGMVREGTEGYDVVPVLVDLSDQRIDLSYAETPTGQFAKAVFNGYVLRFPTDCVLIGGAAIDAKATTLPLTDADLILTPQSLSINVAGHAFDQSTRVGVTLTVMDCPVS